MCLRCGCNGKHLKADGSCLCGCPALVTKWEVTTETPAAEAPKPVMMPFDHSEEKE